MAEADENRKDEELDSGDDVDSSEEEQDEIDTGNDSTDDDSEAEDDADDSDNNLKSKVQYPHLVQDGDTIEDYLKRVEDAYGASSKEGKRLSTELERYEERKLQEIVTQGKSDNDSSDNDTGEPSFGDSWARSEMRRRNNDAFDQFVQNRPLLQGETGETLRNAVKEKFKVYAQAEYSQTGEIPTDITGLLKASYAAVAPDTSEIDSRNDLKDYMGSSKTSSKKKKSTKSQFSEEQIATAQKAFPNLSRKELEKRMAKYA